MESTAARRFTGRQVTVIVVALCAAVVLAPVGVFAAAHAQRVSIVDAKHPARGAVVTAGGRQEVAVTVTGSVKTAPAIVEKPFVVTVSPDANSAVLTLPKGHTVVVQTISADGGTADSVSSLAVSGSYKWQSKFATIGFGLDEGNSLHFFGTRQGPFYADSGSQMIFDAYSPDTAVNTVIANLTVTGYTT